ncbi:hypothetical protein FHETE_8716 [Fusarium heterosporum]|uniref:BZIP domain-containing protein n=1 Tax=Fusarium heterosporum TaxID=42747 RepID=A0A8H5SVR9_FUSHE|nr:hypothetical protein FHETE_8716 [Fusarium heterosporum]
MSPEQQARKRAADREAQRRSRARTRQHIDRLEQELAQLRSDRWRDSTIQDLMCRNQEIEKELKELKDAIDLLGNVLPSAESSDHHLQMAKPDTFLASARNDGDIFVMEEASHSPGENCIPLSGNYNVIYTGLQYPFSNNQEAREDISPFAILPKPPRYRDAHIQTSLFVPMSPPWEDGSYASDSLCFKHLFRGEGDIRSGYGTNARQSLPVAKEHEMTDCIRHLHAGVGTGGPCPDF